MGMNPYSEITDSQRYKIFEAGWNEALLDIFDYQTGNLSFIDDPKFAVIQRVMDACQQVKSNAESIPVEV